MIEVKINTDFIKLDQFLKYENIVSSGGEGKNIIMDGMIKVNGVVEFARGKKLRKGDTIEVFSEAYVIV